ncbi:lysophospholipase L1-like esterase [Nocardioides sp. BE266]|uniref:SGNH/GDSL hydrolase family protein n=1 Tax=Nocardioides sp. BE266 TaxID=2817725 RepID=UPI0028610C47|nr:SGNH/GDSL hydrolase family protein [Nocardioides sp. BE266]MDR7252990.1 lysophospholipase L1-like esterase [Nocardioides sp. BE266]
MKRTSTRLAVLGSALVGLLSPLLVQPAAQAAAPVYVALGDSYSSGTGTRSYISDGTSCQRSTKAYPSLIAAARGYALNFRACSGAKIADVTNTQLNVLTTATNYVTISVGGNDAGFADVLTECALPGWASNCNGKINTAQAYINNTLPAALATLYAGIRSRAPYAKVVVVGYPRIFMGEDCNAFTWFSPDEEARLNQTADLMNTRTAAAAAAAGFSFANPTAAFTGHAVCDNPEYLNGLSNPISESYHPNVLGHASGYTPVVSATVGGAFAVTAKVRADAAASASSQAALQRQYAAADRSIRPEVFVTPDLTTPEVRRAARKAGIDLDRFIARSQRR